MSRFSFPRIVYDLNNWERGSVGRNRFFWKCLERFCKPGQISSHKTSHEFCPCGFNDLPFSCFYFSRKDSLELPCYTVSLYRSCSKCFSYILSWRDDNTWIKESEICFILLWDGKFYHFRHILQMHLEKKRTLSNFNSINNL